MAKQLNKNEIKELISPQQKDILSLSFYLVDGEGNKVIDNQGNIYISKCNQIKTLTTILIKRNGVDWIRSVYDNDTSNEYFVLYE